MHLLLIIFLFAKMPADTLHLANDLKKDSIICSEQHGEYFDHQKKYDWGKFAKYAYLDLSKFKFSIEKKRSLTIKKWVNNSRIRVVIREIDTALVINGAEKCKPKQLYKLKFHIYIIDPYNRKRLVYLTEKRQGLCEYRIGNEVIEPVFEDIPLGFDYPYLYSILKLIPVPSSY